MLIRFFDTRSVLSACAVWLATALPSWAQQQEIFHRSILRTPFEEGILVSATTRNTGAEILRIRAQSDKVEHFLNVRLPPARADLKQTRYDFTLEIGPLPYRDARCSAFPTTKSAFEDCFQKSTTKSVGSLSIAPLPSYGDPETAQFAVKTTGEPAVFGRCLYIARFKVTSSCSLFFEKDRLWHELSTSGQALDDMKLFICTALTLRNRIWPDAPSITDQCGI